MTHLTLSGVQSRRKQVLVALAAAIVFCLLFIRSYWNQGGTAHEVIEETGLALILVCVLGRAWSTLYIGGRKNIELIREGPYSVSRNPLYLFSFLGIAGIGAGAGSVILPGILLLLSYAVFWWVVTREEAYLTIVHGADYERYLREVPRFLPDLRKWRDAEKITVTPRLVVRTAFEASLMFLAYPLFETIEWLQGAGVLTTPILLP